MSRNEFRTLRDVAVAHAERAPDATLLIAPDNAHQPGRRLTYGEMLRQARRLASHLAARGLEPGDKIALLMQNGYQTTSLFLGAMIAGHVVTPLNLRTSRAGLAYAIDHSDCKLLFVSQEQSALLAEALPLCRREIAVETIDVDAACLFPEASPDMALAPLGAADPTLLMYTSGTTGTPKGVMLTHANLLAAAGSAAEWHRLGEADRVLSSLPLYHINGQVIGTLTPFLSGGSIVAPHGFSVSSWWRDVEAYRCTWINIVPTIIAYLLNAAGTGPRRRFPLLRFGRSASAPLPPEQHRAFETMFGVPVIEGMGMTEAASVVFCNPTLPEARRYGSVGLPCGVEARIVDPQGQELPSGEIGEIRLRGGNVMSGYYKSSEHSVETFDNQGYLRSGDLGYRDEDGYFFVTGRSKELVIKGGENIAPREIDEVLLMHPAILEAAAVGVPDPDYGQEILAGIVLKSDADLSEAELRAHCVAHLGRYKTPKFFAFLDELPKGASGKVQRLAIADAWSGQRETLRG
ncbi:long-chain acyl-CoA synthetase [Rhizobiales bacterium GAS113]|nr:long-chain acyl-CoA synthetase [Rhizobiales bacterium GAS113]